MKMQMRIIEFMKHRGVSLHKAFHVHPSIVPIWMKYFWKGLTYLDLGSPLDP